MALHISEPSQRKRRREDDENLKNHISKRTKLASFFFNVNKENMDEGIQPNLDTNQIIQSSTGPGNEDGYFIEKIQIWNTSEAKAGTKLNANKKRNTSSKNPTSIYKCVRWVKASKKWVATFKHKKCGIHVGTFDDDKQAAMVMNYKCEELGIRWKNPGIGLAKPPARDTSSRYKCVCWCKSRKQWKGVIYNKKKSYLVGYFQNEFEAGLAVNFKCQELGIPEKNPNIFQTLLRTEGKKTDYECIHWDGHLKKWIADLAHGNETYHVGIFDDEKHAGMAINFKCKELKIPIKNPALPIKPPPLNPNDQLSSRYKCVYWIKSIAKWVAMLSHNRRVIHIGTFHDDYKAACAVNHKCEELGIPFKNQDIPSLGLPAKHAMSKYIGVEWEKDKKKWKAVLRHDQEYDVIGLFKEEIFAAKAVNEKCKELCIPVKNPTLENNIRPPKRSNFNNMMSSQNGYIKSDLKDSELQKNNAEQNDTIENDDNLVDVGSNPPKFRYAPSDLLKSFPNTSILLYPSLTAEQPHLLEQQQHHPTTYHSPYHSSSYLPSAGAAKMHRDIQSATTINRNHIRCKNLNSAEFELQHHVLPNSVFNLTDKIQDNEKIHNSHNNNNTMQFDICHPTMYPTIHSLNSSNSGKSSSPMLTSLREIPTTYSPPPSLYPNLQNDFPRGYHNGVRTQNVFSTPSPFLPPFRAPRLPNLW